MRVIRSIEPVWRVAYRSSPLQTTTPTPFLFALFASSTDVSTTTPAGPDGPFHHGGQVGETDTALARFCLRYLNPPNEGSACQVGARALLSDSVKLDIGAGCHGAHCSHLANKGTMGRVTARQLLGRRREEEAAGQK